MDFELRPETEEGKSLVALAEEHSTVFWERADRHDREGSFPFENFQEMKKTGVIAATSPKEMGGLGVESAYDWGLGINRLARGDGSTAIALNMHLTAQFFLARRCRMLRTNGDKRELALLEEALRRYAVGAAITCGSGSEPGTDLLHPLLEARRSGKSWTINGRKIFGTLSPVADVITVTVRAMEDSGEPQFGVAQIPIGMSGVRLLDDWDALGMRASGSQSIAFEECIVPEEALVMIGPWGSWNADWFTIFLPGTFGLAAAFLGIAERAQELIHETLTTRRKAPSNRLLAERPALQRGFAENEVDLGACRAMLERTGRGIDALYGRHPETDPPMEDLHAHFKDFQCTKLFVCQKSIDVVDRALTLSGGSGYLSRSPLSRLFRDVRAGPFMQPLSPNEAHEYIGKVALGISPELDG